MLLQSRIIRNQGWFWVSVQWSAADKALSTALFIAAALRGAVTPASWTAIDGVTAVSQTPLGSDCVLSQFLQHIFRTGMYLTRVDCCTGNPFAPGAGTGSNAVSAPPLPTSAPSWGTGQDAAAPPPSASVNEFETSPSGGHFVQPQPFASSNTSSPGGQSGAVPGGALEDENDSCVICMAAPVQAGVLHGSR